MKLRILVLTIIIVSIRLRCCSTANTINNIYYLGLNDSFSFFLLWTHFTSVLKQKKFSSPFWRTKEGRKIIRLLEGNEFIPKKRSFAESANISDLKLRRKECFFVDYGNSIQTLEETYSLPYFMFEMTIFYRMHYILMYIAN